MKRGEGVLLSAWASFFVAHGLAVRRISRQLEGSVPLTMDEYDVLLTIQRSSKGVRLSALADATVFTRSGITRVVKRLEARGFLTRERCDIDGRGTFAQISTTGSLALRQSWARYSQEILEIFSCITCQEGELLSDLMERIINQVREEPLVNIRKRSVIK